MSKVFMTVFLIFGTIVGSGFSSGKEIMVFFSRFGLLSYFYIVLACFFFFLLFYFFLSHGEKISQILKKSKLLNLIIVFISVVFCASMFAGIKSLFSYLPFWVYVILIFLLLLSCIFFSLKGVLGFEKLNMFLMPATSFVFLFVLFFAFSRTSNFSISVNSWAGFLYCPLYVALNTSMSGLIISRVGGSLSKKQAVLSSLFSAILLMIFLLLGNFVLQRNSDCFFSEMPFLSLVSDNVFMFVLTYAVIFVGCFTTLISLCLTLKSSFEKVISGDLFSTLIAVFLPFLISALGFSKIISFLYPICSVLGIFVLFYLIFHTLFVKDFDLLEK